MDGMVRLMHQKPFKYNFLLLLLMDLLYEIKKKVLLKIKTLKCSR